MSGTGTTNVGGSLRICGVWIVCSSRFTLESTNGFLSANNTIIRNAAGQGCPAEQTTFRVEGPRSAGFLPESLGWLPVIGLYGAGVITVWGGFDETWVRNIRRAIDSLITTTCWVESPRPLTITVGANSMGFAPDPTLNPSDVGRGNFRWLS
ncbi:hypothetical protein TrVFT333_007901 [Trichoderma virens FT-333]|nr:hypothetical protein TrVFT333_007901 [Trichoderma virens FT-333]